MLTFHSRGAQSVECAALERCATLTRDAVWVDVCEPTAGEEQALERALGVDVPTREEMQEIEASSRLYRKDGAVYLTAAVISQSESLAPVITNITFIVTPTRLITVRYADPLPFRKARTQRDAEPEKYDTAGKVLDLLLDAIIDRLADILENAGAGIDHVSHYIFRNSTRTRREEKKLAITERGYHGVLRRLGRVTELISHARESIVSLGRIITYLNEPSDEQVAELTNHRETLRRDIASLSDHATFLAGKASFLLDATLGLINVEQNAIIKVFTTAAVYFLPPTLIGTIYGMNFKHMPELEWPFGYLFAVVLMISSAAGLHIYFRRRGWF